jgi:hypothetical protein
VSRSGLFLGWLENKSDWLSPLVVKEVRQVVRGREFMLSFGTSLLAGLAVAFFGAADALSGSNTSGSWTFAALIGCLAFLGVGVVPLGAFNALRSERMEQTFDLIMLTGLSPRRIVIGKLLAQVVKLVTFFAAIAPFIAMSFLLGGIDVVTILISLVVLFMWSMWAGALFLFLSTASKSRAMSGVVFGVVAIAAVLGLGMGRTLFLLSGRAVFLPGPFGVVSLGTATLRGFVTMTAFWLASLVNLILLAENRLSLPTEDSVTPLRIGFLVQFLLMIAWALAFLANPVLGSYPAAGALAFYGGLQLAAVAAFSVTDDLAVPRRVLYRMTSPSRWRWLLVMFGPGAGRGAAYVLVQMVLLVAAVQVLTPAAADLRRLLAALGYICFFTGMPTLVFWRFAPARATPLRLRVAVLLTVAAVMVLPDILHYALRRPTVLDLSYSWRHLVNPFRTLANWDVVEKMGWFSIPAVIGVVGLIAYLTLIPLGTLASRQSRGNAVN